MNKRIAIIIDDIIQANEKGVLTQIRNYIKQHFTKKSKKSLTLKVGDAIILDINGQNRYYSEETNFIERKNNFFVRSVLASSIPDKNTFYLMNDYKKLYNYIQDLLDLSNNDREVVRFVVEEPVRPKVRVKTTIRENIRIFERFVKIGWNCYKRRYDYTSGLDFIDVDGDIFFIKEDRRGNEYLV